jgi:hypothetical protein
MSKNEQKDEFWGGLHRSIEEWRSRPPISPRWRTIAPLRALGFFSDGLLGDSRRYHYSQFPNPCEHFVIDLIEYQLFPSELVLVS